jgi:hypothetical protein
MKHDEIIEMAQQCGLIGMRPHLDGIYSEALEAFAKLVAAKEREAIYQLVMEAPFKEFDRQEEDFDGEAANAMKAMAFSLTSAIRARGEA